MKNFYDIIKTLSHTEKETNLFNPQGKYLFLIDINANKSEVKAAVEHMYKVKVKSVNTLIAPGKAKRVRYQQGYTSDFKKAVVTLRKGQKIELT